MPPPVLTERRGPLRLGLTAARISATLLALAPAITASTCGCVALKESQATLDDGGAEASADAAVAGPDASTDATSHDAAVEAAPAACTLRTTPVGASCALGAAEAPSCAGLAADCGPGESCCTTTHLPGAQYVRSYDRSEQALQDGKAVVGLQTLSSPAATVSDVLLDRYEVTIGRFRTFLATYDAWRANKPFNDDGSVHGAAGTGWSVPVMSPSLPASSAAIVRQLTDASCGSQSGWTGDAGANETLPVTCVSWFVAYAFCIRDGGRLPTEAEWNLAAAGGAQQRAFPWSQPPSDFTTPSLAQANLDNTSGGLGRVGALAGTGLWGHADLAGNAMEWTRDACTDCNEPSASASAPGADLKDYLIGACTDCVQLTGTSRILRGGSFKFWRALGRTAARAAVAPLHAYDDVGFRCARDP